MRQRTLLFYSVYSCAGLRYGLRIQFLDKLTQHLLFVIECQAHRMYGPARLYDPGGRR